MIDASVIILCQGEQRRLPHLDVPKQLLPLDGTRDRSRPDDMQEDVSIVGRTMAQLAMILSEPEPDSDGYYHVAGQIELVGREEPFYYTNEWMRSMSARRWRRILHSHTTELALPGNSSLKGISEYLRSSGAPYTERRDHRTVVLFGDCIYSWDALYMCLNLAPSGVRWINRGVTFCGSHDLGNHTGELWGLQWERSEHARMMLALHNALEKHPPFQDTYQPGQMRRWLWAWEQLVGGHQAQCSSLLTTEPTDYTRDIDIPEHILLLPELAKKAIIDDKEHGLVW